MKKVFIAATKQNDGKTTVSLGLVHNFQGIFKKVAFIKPIGQRYLEEEGLKIDEDSLLIEEVCGIKCGLKDMSPIAVEKGFTERYISKPGQKLITRQIKEAYQRVSKGQDLVVIEGTGHAGVGSVFDHSNATVARLLGAKVIIISSGGIGRPIDEIILNKSLFEKEGVKVLGVIINKVLPAKFEKINRLVRKGLERKGVNVLGVIPYNPMLARPTLEQILEETGFQVVCGKDYLERAVSRVVVGAMEPRDAIKYIVEDSLVITPGDRTDIISTVMGMKIAGIVLTGGIIPDPEIIDSLSKAKVAVLMANSDTYDVATSVHDMTVKIRPRDKEKINSVVELIQDNCNLEMILRGI